MNFSYLSPCFIDHLFLVFDFRQMSCQIFSGFSISCREVENVVGALTPVVSGVAQVCHVLLAELRLQLVVEVVEGGKRKKDRKKVKK